MKMKTVTHFFLVVYVFRRGYCESVPNMETSLLTLINLQGEHCPSVGMCTKNVPITTTVNPLLPNCCKACSCETNCKDLGNCCPDYYIARLFTDGNISQDNTLFNISEWFEELNATFQQHVHEDNGSLSRDEATDNQTDNFSCVRSKAVSKDFHMEEDKYPQAYKMIAKCPKDFNGADDTKSKCNADFQIKTSKVNNVGPDLVVPVTSLKTNYTYKNEYCLLCNERNDVLNDVIQWDVIFTSFNGYYLLGDTDGPYRILEYMTSGQGSFGSNLIYQPRKQVAHLVTRCRKVDVKSCPDGTDTKTVCTRYYMPVISKSQNSKGYVVYNNIACYLCNNKKLFKANCEKMYTPGIVRKTGGDF